MHAHHLVEHVGFAVDHLVGHEAPDAHHGGAAIVQLHRSIMMLRMQLERMDGSYIPSTREYYEFFALDYKKIKHAKENALIMHPGPMNRGIEIDASLADDINRSIIVQQVEMGVAVRMACLKILMENQS